MQTNDEITVDSSKMFNKSDIVLKTYIKDLLTRIPKFSGSLEINIKDGVIKDIKETKRTVIN